MRSSTDVSAPPEFVEAARAFEEQFSYVYRAVRRFGVPPADVEDLVQEVFLVMWRRWREYEPHRPLRAWLAGIAFNIAQKHMSRGRREVPRGEVDREDEAPHPDERLARARSRDLALRALDALPAKQKAIIVMHDLDGQEMRDIAGTLAVPLFTAYSRLRRARLGFARAVQELQHEAIPAQLLSSEREVSEPPPEVFRRARRRFGAAVIALQPSAKPTTVRPEGAGAGAGSVGSAWWALVLGGLAPAAALLLWMALAGGRPGSPSPTAAAIEPPAPAVRATGAPTPRPAVLTSGLASLARPFAGGGEARPAAVALASGLSSYFRFDDGYGSNQARDLSPNGRDCRLHQLDPNGAWTEGALSGAIDVGRGFLECPQPPLVADDRAEMSVSAWVRIDAARQELVAIAARQAGDGIEDYFLLGVFRGLLKVRSDVWNVRANSRRRVPVGRWTHVGFTRSADGTVRLYMAGNKVAVKNVPFAPPRASVPVTGPLTIGGNINGPNLSSLGQKLLGAVDEVAIYDRALAPAEMAALAHGEQPRLSP